MHVRPAQFADVDRIVELGARMNDESSTWSRLTYSPRKVRALAMRLIGDKGGFLHVACPGAGQPVGFMAALCDEHWSSEDRVVVEVALYVEPGARGSSAAVRLVQVFKAWALLQGAKRVMVGCSTGIDDDRAARLYEKLGFRRCSIGLELE